MADPLSVTASVIAIIGSVEATRKGLRKLLALRYVPEVVVALNNDVQDLHLTLREFEFLAAGHDGNVQTKDYLRLNALPHAQRARKSLEKLESLLEYRLKKADGSISKSAWLSIENKVRALQKELRHSRLAITTALSVLNTTTVSRLETRLQELHLATEERHSNATETLISKTQTLERAMIDMVDAQKQSQAHLVSLEDLILTRVSSTESQTSTITSISTDISLPFLVGALFVGYSSVPTLTPPCSTPKCRGSPEGFISMSYYFPRWLVSSVLATAIRFTSHKGPEMTISTLRQRDSTDLIFTAAESGDAVTVRRLITEGNASVIDVASGTGHTPLHLAVIRSHVEVITALLQFGAEPLLENATQETPYDMAWSTVLCFEDTPNSSTFRVEEVKKLFPSTAALEERRTFSRIHQIVLKLIHIDLETELKSKRLDIDIPDSDGRTALHWASGRGDENAVSLLLQYGANPNFADRIGQGPLRSSLKASDPTCMELLIKYGANIMQTDHWEQTCLQAAMYYSDPTGFGMPLIQAGIDINAQDCTKSSALLEAVRMMHHDAVTMLLDNGADVNIRDCNGLTPLLEAVARNDHVAVKLILRTHIVDATARDGRQRNVLHYAAEHADIAMLRLLAVARLEDLDVKSAREDGLSAIDIAEKRFGREVEEASVDEKLAIDEDWIKTFTVLLESVMERARLVIPPFKDEEDQSTEFLTDSPADSLYLDALQ
ncbi:hypothetical protein LTR97_008136 [Elasticomyces elasticus]|uniref:Fungal N-terminal domain-containing protein n=1 Tax=Elasticomyces elasticus TaxID=574655 RepID=A0AAN7W614_9PEZI|nr:hypothetical protein LTR97_008136 [Elasticomyces elasticus]